MHPHVAPQLLCLLSALWLSACNLPPAPNRLEASPLNPVSGASISGKLRNEPGEPVSTGSVLLFQSQQGRETLFRSVNSNSAGEYLFSDLPAGRYRLAYSFAAPEQQQALQTYADPSASPQHQQQSQQLAMLLSTQPFDFQPSAPLLLEPLNVGWVSRLSPLQAEVALDQPFEISWAPIAGAQQYLVEIRDSAMQPFYKSEPQPEPGFSWQQKVGNQGAHQGKAAQAGESYYYLIVAQLRRNADPSQPSATLASTALVRFSLR